MSAGLVFGILTLAQAPGPGGIDLRDYLPSSVGATYSYWCEFGTARDPLDMTVVEVGDEAVRLDGFPAPWLLVAGGPAGVKATLRVDEVAATILVSDGQRERPLCTVPADARPGPSSTWAADYAEGLVCPLTVEPDAVTGQVMLARGVGVVAIIFESPQGKGEYVLVKGPEEPPTPPEPRTITALRHRTAYTYRRTDEIGEAEVTSKVGDIADHDGGVGVAVRGLPWFDQACERPLAERERTVAVDIAGRCWRELVDGRWVELFSFNLAPEPGTVTVPAGTFEGCFRLTSVRPGLEAILHPDTGFVRWVFETILGPVTYDLVRVEPYEPELTAPSESAEVPPAEGATEPRPAETVIEPAPDAVTPPEELAPVSDVELRGREPAHGSLVWSDADGIHIAGAGGAVSPVSRPAGAVELVAASAEGAAIAYVAAVDSGWALCVIAPPGSSERVVRRGTRDALVTSLEWSPDGARLLYAIAREILVYELASGVERTLCVGDNPQWARAGDVLYESGRDPDDEEVGVLRMPADGGPPDMIAPWGFGASVSADGRVLAYMSPQQDDDPRVHVAIDGVDTELAGSSRFDRGPVVSPSGRFIAVARYVTDTVPESWTLRLVDRASGLERDVVKACPSWPVATFWQDDALLIGLTAPDGARSWLLVDDPGDPGATPKPLFAEASVAPTVATPIGAAARR